MRQRKWAVAGGCYIIITLVATFEFGNSARLCNIVGCRLFKFGSQVSAVLYFVLYLSYGYVPGVSLIFKDVCSKFKRKEGGIFFPFSPEPRRDFAKYVNYAPGASSLLQTVCWPLPKSPTYFPSKSLVLLP